MSVFCKLCGDSGNLVMPGNAQHPEGYVVRCTCQHVDVLPSVEDSVKMLSDTSYLVGVLRHKYTEVRDAIAAIIADRARLVAENTAQAERIEEMEARPLIPAGANVTVHFPPMPESELVSHLQDEIIRLHKEIHRLRGHRLPSEYFSKEAHND